MTGCPNGCARPYTAEIGFVGRGRKNELIGVVIRIRPELEVDLARPTRADLAATHHSVLEKTETLQRLVGELPHLARGDAGVATRLIPSASTIRGSSRPADPFITPCGSRGRILTF